jgi:hypothetical protein
MSSVADSPRIAALRSAPLDAWVALSDDESKIIATGATYEEAALGSDRAGVPDPIIIKTPAKWLPFCV